MKQHPLDSALTQQSASRRAVIRTWLILAVIALLTLLSTRLANAQGLLYFVNTTSDTVVAGACANGTAGCSLRGAIEEANSHVGDDGIEFDLPAGSLINLTQALPDLSEGVSITGPVAEVLIVRRDTGGDYRIFNVTTSGVVALSNMSIQAGQAPPGTAGGGIQNLNGGVVHINDCNITDSHADNGGCISNTSNGTVNITNCLLFNSIVSGQGGGLCNLSDGIVNVTRSTLNGNLSSNRGGGIANEGVGGVVNLIDSTLIDNEADFGGGVNCFNGTVNLSNCTFISNSASVSGGAIFAGITVNVTNCTFSANEADFGGGITSAGVTNLSNSTISGNSANEGGGIFVVSSGTVNVKSSIIALNTAPSFSDVEGSFTSLGYNLIGKTDGSSGFTQPTDQTGTTAAPLDPRLDPSGPQDNGGPTETIALLFGSPAIDQGTSDALTGTLTSDQRGIGFPRTFDDPAIANAVGGDGTDIGAFEVQTATPTPTPTPSPSPTPTPTPTTFGNISTRLRVETGDNVLIGGFIITGTQAKKVMVRAIGPSLPLVDALGDPTLELRDGTGALISSNDNWMDAPNKQEIIDTTIAPTNDFESAILMSLDPGLYTTIVRGVNNTTGIGLVEAYDLDLAVDSILANISTRGLVQTSDNVMIGGIIILGTDPQEVLLRAIGPSLPVPGALADPTLELHDKDGVIIASNDDWRSDQEAEIIATNLPPTEDAESAILATLTPDAYTAIMRGKDDTTGVALVEAYQLDN